MNGTSSLNQLAGDLDFLLGASMPTHAEELVKYRSLFHKNIASMCSQTLFIAQSISNTKKALNGQSLKVAILFPDVMPSDCEWIGKVLLINMFKLEIVVPSDTLVVTNRPNIQSMLGPEFTDCKSTSVCDKKLTEYDYIIVNSGLMYIGLKLESLLGYQFKKSIFSTTRTSISRAKVDSLFAKIGTVVPFYPSTDVVANPGKDKGVIWTSDDVTSGFVLPDMDRLKKCLAYYCKGHGKQEEEIQELLSSALPNSLIDGIENWKEKIKNCDYRFN